MSLTGCCAVSRGRITPRSPGSGVDCSDEFAGLFSQVLQVAATLGMVRFATVAIDGTKIAANASIDANRGREWFDAQATAMITDADQVDHAEQAEPAGSGPGPGRSGRLWTGGTDPAGRR